MSWDQLAALAAAGWEIGSHTQTHPHLTELAPDRLAEELAGSRAEIERNLGLPCPAIAYPYGDHDDAVLAAATRGRVLGGLHAAEALPDRPSRSAGRGSASTTTMTTGASRMKISPAMLRLRSSFVWRAVEAAGRG